MSARWPVPTMTLMSDAFLRGLLHWAARQLRRRQAERIALPSVVVSDDELLRVLVALLCTRRGSGQ